MKKITRFFIIAFLSLISYNVNAQCFTTFPENPTNLCPDPQATDLSLWNGWGPHREVITDPNTAFCGDTYIKIVSNGQAGCVYPGNNGEDSALDINMDWEIATYRVQVAVKTIGGNVGFVVKNGDNFPLNESVDTGGEWQVITHEFTTTIAASGFITLNTCDQNATASEVHIDNFELYRIDNIGANIPKISIIGANPVEAYVSSVYNDKGASALDLADGSLTANIITVSTVDTSTEGTYTVTYNVSDSDGNAASEVTRTVNVIAGVNPIITLTGDATVQVLLGSTYIDEGATAFDSTDGDLTSNIVTVNTVDTSIKGTYTITYNVTDSDSNAATEVTRTVIVITDYDEDGIADENDSEIYWTGATSSDFGDDSNWAGKPATFDQYEGDYHIGATTNSCDIPGRNNLGGHFVIYMKQGGVLNVNAQIYFDNLHSTAGENSDIYINNGGDVNVRGVSRFQGGNIHVLEGGSLSAKQNWNWGRWDEDDTKIYANGGTVALEGMAPWRNKNEEGAIINNARVIISNEGIVSHTDAAILKSFGDLHGIIPAEGSLLTYTTDALQISSVDISLPSSYEVTSETAMFTVPDFSTLFPNYSSGDTTANATITVTQDIAAGTDLTTQIVVNVTATDAFDNTITKAISVAQEGQLSIDDNQISQTNLTTVDRHVYVTNINESTTITIYNLTGAIVKSIITSEDTNFTLNSGIYIAKITSIKTGAKKTTKFIVK